jgi:hypothetical protein
MLPLYTGEETIKMQKATLGLKHLRLLTSDCAQPAKACQTAVLPMDNQKNLLLRHKPSGPLWCQGVLLTPLIFGK